MIKGKTAGQVLYERKKATEKEKEKKLQEEEKKLRARLQKAREDRFALCADIRYILESKIANENIDPDHITYKPSKTNLEWIRACQKNKRSTSDADVWDNFVEQMLAEDIEIVLRQPDMMTDEWVIQAIPRQDVFKF